MADRRQVIAANWKMNKTVADAEAFLGELLGRAEEIVGPELIVCPPYTALARAVELCAGTGVVVGAQNMHAEDSGAYTGEVSAPMLVEAGVAAVILGHSERRRDFAESDEALARKIPAALDAGLIPILCCGETEAERDAGKTETVVGRQVSADLAEVPDERLAEVVVAYEPIWAIGTGRTASADQADEACGQIRAAIAERDAGAAERIRIQYGGSVKPDNAGELLGREHVDGALVGGASLEARSFAAIVAAA